MRISERAGKLFGTGSDLNRMIAFSDAVIAIALTLLVLDIRLPEVDSDGDLWAAIGSLWPNLFAYALSFLIIAINWVNHHRKFQVIERFDSGLLWLNLVFLFFIALTPFPTSLLAEFGPTTASVVIYAAEVSVLSVSQGALWIYAHRRHLLADSVDDELYRFVRRNVFVTPVVFGASIIVAFFNPTVAMYTWFLLFPALALSGRLPVSRSRDSASEATS